MNRHPLDGPTRAELSHHERIDWHDHAEQQLAYPSSGMLIVSTATGSWVVPPQRAVWLPAGTEHSIHMMSDVEMRNLYFHERSIGHLSARSDVFEINGLLRELIASIAEHEEAQTRDEDYLSTAYRLAMLELHRAEDSTTFIPLPQEPRCRRAAEIVLDDPAALHEIDTLARKVGTSARTLSRLFSSETQLSFKSWCQRARIAAAIEKLSTKADVSVKQIAREFGYASVPAFSHAFRQVTGKTPTEFTDKA